MEKYLESLRNALEEAKVENVDEIIASYLEHFSLGHEAGMTDEEIIERFDSIEDIVHSYIKKLDEEVKGFKLDLDLSNFDEFDIVLEEGKAVRLSVDEDVLDYIEVIKEENFLSVKNKKLKKGFFTKNNDFDGTLYIGRQVIFDEIIIGNVSADMEIGSLNSKTIIINNVSGDIEFDSLNAKEKIKLSNVSGDLEIKNINVPKMMLETVNGDIDIEELCADSIKVDTVNGDVKVEYSNAAEWLVNSVNGNIEIKEGKATVVVNSNVNGDIIVEGEKVSTSVSEVVKNALTSAFKGWKF